MLKKYALKMGVRPCPFCGGYPTIDFQIIQECMQSAAGESRAINKELETLQQNVISHHLLEKT